MVDVIVNNQLDLLHVHYAVPHASAAYMAKKIVEKTGRTIPVITTLHGTDITLVGKDKTFAPVVTFSINESDAITAVSENLKQETFRNFRIEKDIEVIQNFVDVARFQKKPLEAFRNVIAPNGERILLHASNFRKVKRVEDVIRIFGKVIRTVPTKLLLVGDGPERAMAESLCREMNLCDDIRFLGKQEQIEDILAITDIFLLTSEYESFGLAAMEAMAAGVPVISTNAGGLPEINKHGETGYLCNVGDIDQMSAYTIELLRDNEKMARFRNNAAAHAKEYDIDRIIPVYESLYNKFL
jgi:N-acetyl-alpha-D-glucosaminyl L-malate synthase BshA